MTATKTVNEEVIFEADTNGTYDSIVTGGRKIPDKKNEGKFHRVILFEDGAECVIPSTYRLNMRIVKGMRMAAYWEDNRLHLEVIQ